MEELYPELFEDFFGWFYEYTKNGRTEKFKNKVVFNPEDEKDFYSAIIYYIAGMTDNYAIKVYNNIIRNFA